MQRENLKVAHEKRSLVKSRGVYFFFREYWDEILRPRQRSKERKRFFFNPHDETKKLDSSDLSLSHI